MEETTEDPALKDPATRLCPECSNVLLQIHGVTAVNVNVPSDTGANYVSMEIADSWYCARCTWHEQFDGKKPDTSWLKKRAEEQRKQREDRKAEPQPESPGPQFPDPLKALGEGLQAIGNMGTQALNMAQTTMNETIRQGQELNQRMTQLLATIAPILPQSPQPVDPEPSTPDPEDPPKKPPTAPIFGGGSEAGSEEE